MLTCAASHQSPSVERHRDSVSSGRLQSSGDCARVGRIDGRRPSVATESTNERAFRSELEALIPQLRAFARSLCGRRDFADDLVQDALLKAWAARSSFRAGTNMRAWTFIILRNVFLSQMRRARFSGEWHEEAAEQRLAAPASQEKSLHLSDLQRAVLCLPTPQREALILVGAGGLAYEEVATICGCAVGTVKSRVARARVAVEKMLVDGTCPERTTSSVDATEVSSAIIDEVEQIVAQNRA